MYQSQLDKQNTEIDHDIAREDLATARTELGQVAQELALANEARNGEQSYPSSFCDPLQSQAYKHLMFSSAEMATQLLLAREEPSCLKEELTREWEAHNKTANELQRE